MNRTIFKTGKKYTFSDYFYLNYPTEEIINALGYSFCVTDIQFPISQELNQVVIDRLTNSYYELLPKITLHSEVAKREFIIAPVLQEVIRPLVAKLYLEYPIEIDDHLSGTIDYLIRSTQQLIIIEAKRGELDRGFNQLAAELIALDQYEDQTSATVLYGAITIGELWRFAVLKRKEKQISKACHTFRFPEDLAEIWGILKGILCHQDLPAG